MTPHELRDFVYGQIARIGKAVSSPKRLEILDLLSQGEKSVETLSERSEMSIKLTSSHLKELRAAHLVEKRKEGKYVIYRLADESIIELWVKLRSLAETQYHELTSTLEQHGGASDETYHVAVKQVFEKAKKGDLLLLDVRPLDEYLAGHLPFAQSIPIEELRKRMSELPKGKEIVTYCKGSHCLQANVAVKILRKRGYKASRLKDGITDFRAEGVTLEK
ncbi:metalloregulator ArsR/SmtB family transcription factor [Bdellovibrionota bacterium FG-2]